MGYCKGGCGHKLILGAEYCGGGVRCVCGGNGEKPCPKDKMFGIDELKEQLRVANKRVEETRLESAKAEAKLKAAEEKLIEWRKLSRQNAVEATSAERQLEGLLDFLRNEAPHMSNCRYMWGEDCNCWKGRSPIRIVEQDEAVPGVHG